jgi:hypothetical protein
MAVRIRGTGRVKGECAYNRMEKNGQRKRGEGK